MHILGLCFFLAVRRTENPSYIPTYRDKHLPSDKRGARTLPFIDHWQYSINAAAVSKVCATGFSMTFNRGKWIL